LIAIKDENTGLPIFINEKRFHSAENIITVAKPMRDALVGIQKRFDNTVDYRGENVLAISRYLDDYKLGMVAKLDRRDVFGPIYFVFIVVIVLFFIVLVLYILLSYLISRRITQSIYKLKENVGFVELGDLNYDVRINSKDEIGELSQSFFNLINKIKKERSTIEKKIQQRTEQLEKINKVMIGRELKMIELKSQIKNKK